MKTQLLAVTAIVFLLCSSLRADYPVINICVGVNENQVNPAVYSDTNDTIVVWEDPRHGSTNVEIYWVRLSDPNLINNRISQTGNQKFPAISGNTVVWQDEYISTNREIYTYNLTTSQAYRLADGVHQRSPEISNGWVVCESYNGSSAYNAAVWNSASSSYNLIAPSVAAQMQIAIDGSMVVWRDDRNSKSQIYRCNLSVTPYAAAPVYTLTSSQTHPAVSGNRIVWQDLASASLVAYDMTQGIIWTHALTGSSDAYTSMSGDLLVWQELRAGGSDYNIRGYDFSTAAYLDIATGTQDDRNPSISGRTVVWQRGGTDILGAVIPTPAVIALTAPNGGETFLAGTEIEVAWQMVAGDAPAAVDIEFSANNGDSWTVIGTEVPFAGTFVWTSPGDTDSQQCLFRVKSAGDALVTDSSDAAFAIFQCSAALTADLTGDCFVGIEDFAALAAQWLTCGSPDQSWCSGQ